MAERCPTCGEDKPCQCDAEGYNLPYPPEENMAEQWVRLADVKNIIHKWGEDQDIEGSEMESDLLNRIQFIVSLPPQEKTVSVEKVREWRSYLNSIEVEIRNGVHIDYTLKNVQDLIEHIGDALSDHEQEG